MIREEGLESGKINDFSSGGQIAVVSGIVTDTKPCGHD